MRTEYTYATVDGAPDAQLLRIIPGIALLPRPNIRVILSADLEWAKNMPPVGAWDAAGGAIALTGTATTKFQAETINATVGVGF